MDEREIHRRIRGKMGIKRIEDNLPFGSHRGYGRTQLAELLAEMEYNLGAEVGVRRGKFCMQLCKFNPNLTMYAIDPWNAYHRKYGAAKQEKIYQEAVRNLEPYNVNIIRKTSMDALDDFDDESLDFVHIDGDHSFDYVAPDIIFWSKKVKPKGMVLVHDYYPFGWAGVMKAVEAYTHCHHIDPWYVTKEYEPTAYWVKP